MTIKLLFFLCTSLLLFSCNKSITIHVNPDGSARVHYLLKYDDFSDKSDSATSKAEQKTKRDSILYFYKNAFASPEISDFKCHISKKQNPDIAFRIAHLDSVARFLNLESDSVQHFIFTKPHQIILDAGMSDAPIADSLQDKPDYNVLAEFRFDLTIYTPEKIKNVINESGLPVKVSGKKFYLKTNLDKIANSGKRNLIIIEY